ncbi:MAG: transcription elongation factor GreA [Candidatus Omnitrophica bacterium]|nr:transcription elongation factor GreA [Candidatus Omnitrophota bacterium]
MADDIYLTREGNEKMYQALQDLKTERGKIAKAIEEARLQGDLSENAEYDAAKEAQGHNNARVQDLEDKLSRVRVIEDVDIPGDRIYIGAIAKLLDRQSNEEVVYQLLSEEESNYEENKISIYSPIGKALMGKAEGEEVTAHVPAGILKYKVLKIDRP